MSDASDILARWEAVCEAAKAIPTDARADWDGSNHYEIQSPKGDSFWWLRCRDIDFEAPVDISATEDGQRLGMVLDFACAARTGWPATIRALKVLISSLQAVADLGDLIAKSELKRVTAILEGRDAQ